MTPEEETYTEALCRIREAEKAGALRVRSQRTERGGDRRTGVHWT